MRYQAGYSFSFFSSLRNEVTIPLQIDFGDFEVELTTIDEDRKYSTGYVEGNVDRNKLRLSDEDVSADGTEMPPRIVVPMNLEYQQIANRTCYILSFVIDVPVRCARTIQADTLIAEGDEDEKCLSEFGTSTIFHTLGTSLELRTFVISDLRNDHLDIFVKRESGIALYSQALLQLESTGRYRDFWRVLESAFGVKNADLVNCLEEYKPAREMGFTKSELEELLVLRGRASHAYSSAGIKEIRDVGKDIDRRLARLKNLAERVILTKKTWGVRSLGIDPIAHLAGFVGEDGSGMIFENG